MRIAILGLGFMGSTHLKAWKNIPDAEVVAVFSEDDRKLSGDLSDVKGNLGGSGERYDFSSLARYKDWQQAIEDPQVEAVDICLPTHLHSDAALAGLRAGKHVLVEKPMALNGAKADEILAEAKARKRVLMAAQVLRFVPAYRALISALESGEYGPVRTAIFRRRCAAPFWNRWLADPALSGGGIFDLLIHDVDLCLKLWGMPTSLSATGYEDLDGGIDTITAALHYRDVPSVIITGGWHHKKSYPFSMEYTVVTDGGTFEYSSAGENGVKLYRSDGEVSEVSLSDEDGFEAELKYFQDCCTRGSKPEYCPPEESAAAVKLTLAMREARKHNGDKILCQL